MTEPIDSQPLTTAVALSALRRNFGPLLRLVAGWLTWLYAGGLVLLLAWLEWWGEHFSLTGALLFAPPLIFLTPLAVLSPFCLFVRARLIVVHVLIVALVIFGYMGCRRASPPPRQDEEIRLVTHNGGQSNRAQFYSFVEAEKPDIIALQDARGRGSELAKRYPGKQVAGHGEFYVASSFPILTSGPVNEAKWFDRPIAARFELLCHEKPLVVYNVHLPTPRRQLNRFLSGSALGDFFVEEDRSRRPVTYQEWTRARLKLADDLAAVFAKEKLPFIACGDFNTPDHGVIYHTVAREMTDAHVAAGHGFGFTFPGTTSNPFSLRRPWIRIDYAFAGRGWEPITCTPEPGRRSQHCAVVARFAPKP